MNVTCECFTTFLGFESTLGYARPKTNASVQEKAVFDLITRIVADRASEFKISVDKNFGPVGKDTFKVLRVNLICQIFIMI